MAVLGRKQGQCASDPARAAPRSPTARLDACLKKTPFLPHPRSGAQEPGSNKQVKSFAKSQYNVSFPLFSKVGLSTRSFQYC